MTTIKKGTGEIKNMKRSKHILEFFPEVMFTIPESSGGSCCLKPFPKQTERSRKMFRYAKHLGWKNKDSIEMVIPSKSESRVRAIVKWKKFKARLRLRRLGIRVLPALVLDGKILRQGKIEIDNFELENL